MFFIVYHHDANNERQFNTVCIDQNGAFLLEIRSKHCLILLSLAIHGLIQQNCTVCSVREYRSNIAETYYRQAQKIT